MPAPMPPSVKKNTEKYIRAERKNRLERTRLDLKHRFYEREKFRTRHVIDREKKLVVRGFDNVKRTSGYSDEGLEPNDEKDRAYKKAQVYKTGLRLSENRLTNWRNHEKDLERFLERELEKNRPKSSKVRFSISSDSTKPMLQSKQKGPATTSGKTGTAAQAKRSSMKSSVSSQFLDEESNDEDFSDSGESSSENTTASSVRIRPSTSHPDSRRPSKKVTFQRPYTAGKGLKGETPPVNNSNQWRLALSTESAKDAIEHFVITKGGVLMNKGGKYHKLHTHTFHGGAVFDRSPSISSKSRRWERHDHFLNRSSMYSSDSDMLSECSDEDSLMNFPLDMNYLPIPPRAPLGRPNSRLGIFLPSEQEFGRRRISSNSSSGKGKDPVEITNAVWSGKAAETPTLLTDWKSKLRPDESSGNQIRSMTSLPTVLRAAMAFSRTRRHGILQDILKEKDFEEQEMKKQEKRRRDTIYLHAPPLG